jgi:ERCC4-type nuclease
MVIEPTLICDTREKNPLIIPDNRVFADVIKKKLDTGDYSVAGLETYLCIERKGCVSEFAGNLFQDRFDRELQRMVSYKYAFILLEFSLEDLLKFPYGSGLSKSVIKRIHYSGKLLLKKMTEIQCNYPSIHIIFCGDNILDMLYSICKRVVEKERYNG